MLSISDLHWRTDTPSWRKEKDYAAEVLRPQLEFLLNMGEPIVVAGDVFHRSADFSAAYDLFTFLKERKAVLYVTRGQHDMIYHSATMERTGVNFLIHAGALIPLGATPLNLGGRQVCGMGWGEDIPETPADVLVAHISISHKDAVIKGASTATAFREKAAHFGRVFTGDNHKRFEVNGLYNAGCFHQMTSDLVDQPPGAWWTVGETVTFFEIPTPAPLIDESYMARQEKGEKTVAGVEFIKALADAREHGGADTFLAALKSAMSETEGQVKLFLEEVIDACEEKHL